MISCPDSLSVLKNSNQGEKHTHTRINPHTHTHTHCYGLFFAVLSHRSFLCFTNGYLGSSPSSPPPLESKCVCCPTKKKCYLCKKKSYIRYLAFCCCLCGGRKTRWLDSPEEIDSSLRGRVPSHIHFFNRSLSCAIIRNSLLFFCVLFWFDFYSLYLMLRVPKFVSSSCMDFVLLILLLCHVFWFHFFSKFVLRSIVNHSVLVFFPFRFILFLIYLS